MADQQDFTGLSTTPPTDPALQALRQVILRARSGLGARPAPTDPSPFGGNPNVKNPFGGGFNRQVPTDPVRSINLQGAGTFGRQPMTAAQAAGDFSQGRLGQTATPIQMPQAPAPPAPSLPAPLAPTDTEQAVAALGGLTPGAVQGGTSASVEGGVSNPTSSGPANYMHWTTPEESAALTAQRAKYNVPEALAGLASANQYNNFTPGAFKPTLPSLKVYNG